MNNKSKVILVLLGLTLLLQGGNMFYGFFTRVYPLTAKFSLATQAGVWGLLAGALYYFVSLAGFFLQKPVTEPRKKQMLIAGRPFKADWSFFNPTNHLILSTILLFCSFAAILVSQLPRT